jgi:hypothetical protein
MKSAHQPISLSCGVLAVAFGATSVPLVSACGSSGDSGGSSGNGTASSGRASGSSGNTGQSGDNGNSGSNSGISGGPSGSGTSGSSGGSSGSVSSGTDDGGSSGTGDGGGVSSGTEGGMTSGDGASGSCFPPATDFTAAGTFTATSGDVTSVACTIFRPTVLGAGGCLNPLIVWGNGTTNTPSSYTALFNHLASHGFIVAAADTSNSGSGKEMIACLQYMSDQNAMAGSPYQGHVDMAHIAASGYSQGGAGCLEAALDPRFTVTAPVSPYIAIALGGFDSTSIGKQTRPMFMISGSADAVAVPSNNQQPIFQQAMVPIFWATHAGSTHFEVLGAGGAYAGPLTAWFRYQLMGDASAGQWFEKPACTLCSASGWTVQTNSLWK